MVFAITYDLNTPGKDYSSLYEAIKSFGAWGHFLDSFWLVDTQLPSARMSDLLRARIDANDSFLVIRVTRDYHGWMNQEAWDWLNQRAF